MTREEAIAEFKEELEIFGGEHREAMLVAIEALSQPIVAKCFDIQSGYIYCSPQIAENVKVVVRCKDCRHANKSMFCSVYLQPRLPSDFCSYGERKEE